MLDSKKEQYKDYHLYFQDESRFGMFTKNGKMLTASAVKPICAFQQVFQSTYLFGSYAPKDGHSFSLELPNCSAEMFQIYLDKMSLERPEQLKVIILDNGAFHKAKKLKIPENIALIFQPPYCPELNAAEKIWARFKRAFTNILCKNLDEVSQFIQNFTQSLTTQEIISTTKLDYVKPFLN